MVKGIGGFGFLNSRHCEKTSYIAFGGLIGTIVFFLIFFFRNSLPTVNLPVFGTQPYLFVALAFFIGGYIGVSWYRFSNHKHPIFIWDFWNAK